MGTDVVESNKDAIELKERIENNTVVEYWQSGSDFDHLAETTIKTMRYINEEQVKEFSSNLMKMNEKILNLTLEGVKKRHENEMAGSGKKSSVNIVYAFIAGALAGVFVTLLVVRAMA